MIKDMKSVAVLALTLWTISSPALAAIRTGCVAAGGDTLAYCTDATAGDLNAVCGTTDCECSAAYKAESDVCVAKGLTDTCTDVADCAGVTYAVCDGTSSVCVCSGAYKDNAAGDGCEAIGLTDTCTDVADCAGVTYAVCDGTSSVCVCSGAYKDNAAGDGCEAIGLTDTCTDVADCAGVTYAVCDGTSSVCVCSGAYKDNAAGDGCEALGLTDTCTDVADCAGVTNAVCDGTSSVCVCSGAYKNNAAGDGCEAIGLTDTCTDVADCAGVTYAVCDGTSSVCVCSGAYKDNAAGDGCEAKSIRTGCVAAGGDTLAYCTDAIAGDPNAVCGTTDCECSAAYTAVDDVCVAKGLTDTCTDVADCAGVTNAVCDGTSSVCVCSGAYKDNSAGDGCEAKSIRTGCVAAGGDTLAYCTDATAGDPNAVCGTTDCECTAAYTAVDDVCVAKENGARGMTANIGLLCAILMMLSYVNTL